MTLTPVGSCRIPVPGLTFDAGLPLLPPRKPPEPLGLPVPRHQR